MPNQNDNRIAALKKDVAELKDFDTSLLELIAERQAWFKRVTDESTALGVGKVEVTVEEVDAEALAKQAEIEAQQAELIDEIAKLEDGIEGHNSAIDSIREDKKALQKQSEDEQGERKNKENKLKRARAKLAALGAVIDETYDNPEKERVVNAEVDGKPANIRFTQLEEFKQPYTEDPNYHKAAPGTGSVVD